MASLTSKTHTLSDGSTLRIRTGVNASGGVVLTEVPSRLRTAGSLLWLAGEHGGPLYYISNRNLVPITHPDYRYAYDRAGAVLLALAFFVDSAEACIAHAAREGCLVSDCY